MASNWNGWNGWNVNNIIPKNFLFISLSNLIWDIARQISKEWHNVKYYVKDEEEREVADGFITKVDNREEHVDRADVVVFDDVLGQWTIAKQIRDKGKLVIWGTPYTDLLEDDRSFGQEEMKRFGISILPYWNFEDDDEAIEFIKQNPDKYVLKPNGDALKRILFVWEDDFGKDVIQVIQWYKDVPQYRLKSFQLQKKISTWVEVAVWAFFNGKEFIYPINVNFEHKKLFPWNLGPSTWEMWTSMFRSGPNKLFNATLKKMEGKLAEEWFIGYIDINCIVNYNWIYPLEFTSRFGYPTISIQQESMITPIWEFFYGLASGMVKTFKVKSWFHLGLRIVVPPFPYGVKEIFEEYSKNWIIFFKKPVYDGIHIEDVKLTNNEWVLTWTSWVVLIVCGSWQTMKQAQDQMYNRVKNIIIPNAYYRKDIGDRRYEDSDKLHNWWYLREA